jgi:hypothetical protein
MTQQKAGTGSAPVPNPTGMVATIPVLAAPALASHLLGDYCHRRRRRRHRGPGRRARAPELLRGARAHRYSWPPTKSLSRASYLDQPVTGGLPASDGLFDLREEAGGVRFEVRIQKVTRRSPRAGLICAFCRDFVLLRTSHFPPHLPVEHVDNSGCASAARSGRRVRCGEGASVRKALAGWDPLFGGRPARSPQRAGFSSKT